MWSSLLACFALSNAYVLSLHAWGETGDSASPRVIKRRFASALVMSLVSPAFAWLFLDEGESLADALGLRAEGLLAALSLPALLTAALYAGQLAMYTASGVWTLYLQPEFWRSNLSDLVWIRNNVVAPLSEELTYRACMMPVLLRTMSPTAAVCACSLLFGTAHFHHALEKLASGQSASSAIGESCFQFAYTTPFGAYSAFLFARTGHLVAPVVVHAMCNHLGFPNFAAVRLYPRKQGFVIAAAFIIGLATWAFLLTPLTEPSFYGNADRWKSYV